MPRLLPALLLFAFSHSASALHIQISAASLEHPALPTPLTNLRVECRVQASALAAHCEDGRLHAALAEARLDARFNARVAGNGRWQLQADAQARALTLSDPTGRYASEKLDLDLHAELAQRATTLDAKLRAQLPRGQAYVEPVFVDFGTAPATLTAALQLDTARAALVVDRFVLEQTGVLRVSGNASLARNAPPRIEAIVTAAHLAPAFATYVQPFLAGTRLETLRPSGLARGRIALHGAQVQTLALHLEQAGIESESYASGLRDVNGALHWSADRSAPASDLRWSGGHLAKLELGAAQLRFRAQARDIELLAPLRLPLAGGALNLRELAVQRAGAPDMAARFDAEIEPIDLAALCRAFGWPEFGGQLGGSLPGLSLQDRELKLDGALTAKAFDGDIALDGLRVLDPFGRVPRVEADLRLRNLDLAALTGAFSFGRIEGRLDGDVRDLRLLDWQPISFRARLATPADDRSRHRISQRAIDSLSSLGGGPTGLLSRGALSFFEDFAYERIGWSCVLADGVCQMDGLEPARGGYVLVKGRWLPRIDVVGYNRRVDWNTFVTQLRSVRGQDAQVR